MKYLLDTDVLIDHIRGKTLLDLQILKKGATISIITLGELFFGAYKSVDPEKTLAHAKKNIESLQLDVVNLDEEIIDEFGQLKASLEKSGSKQEDFDLLIAATAKATSSVLVTRNLKHFKRIENLKIA